MLNVTPLEEASSQLSLPSQHSSTSQFPPQLNGSVDLYLRPSLSLPHLSTSLATRNDSSTDSESDSDDSDEDQGQDSNDTSHSVGEEDDDEPGDEKPSDPTAFLIPRADPVPSQPAYCPNLQVLQLIHPPDDSRECVKSPSTPAHQISSSRKPGKRAATEMATSTVLHEPASPQRRQYPVKFESDGVPDNRPRQPPVSSPSPSVNRPQTPASRSSPVSPATCTPPQSIDSSKAPKKRRVASSTSADASSNKATIASKSRGGRTTVSSISLPIAAIHPPAVPVPNVTPALGTAGEIVDPLGYTFQTGFELEDPLTKSFLSQMYSRASRRLKELDSLRLMAEHNCCSNQPNSATTETSQTKLKSEHETSMNASNATTPVETLGSSQPTGTSISKESQTLSGCTVAQLQLARLAEISEREIRLAAVQQFCFRILRNLNFCFPGWANRNGSYLWHSAFILGSTSLRDLSPYCVIFEEVWDEVRIRYAESFRQVMEQRGSQDGATDLPKPKELSGGLLTALMFQGDSVTYTNCLVQLDNIRQRIDGGDIEPVTDFHDILAAFSAAQTLHAQHQPPSKFILSPITKFKSASEFNVFIGRGGKRKSVPTSLAGSSGSSAVAGQTFGTGQASGGGRGRGKKGVRGGASTNAPSIVVQAGDTGDTTSMQSTPDTPTAPSRASKQAALSNKTSAQRNNGEHRNDNEESDGFALDANSIASGERLAVTSSHQQKSSNNSSTESHYQAGMNNNQYHPYSHAHQHQQSENDWDDDDDDDDGDDESDHSSKDSGPLSVLPTPLNSILHPYQYSHPPYGSSDISMIPGHSPLLASSCSLTSANFLSPVDSSPSTFYSVINPATTGVACSGRIPSALPTTPHQLKSELHINGHPQSTLLESAPSTDTHAATTTSNNNSLPPDAFELPTNPESFRSQVKGVYYDDTSNRWCASWHERKTGKKRSRYFAVKKFGFAQAKTNAMDARLVAEESGECAPTNLN